MVLKKIFTVMLAAMFLLVPLSAVEAASLWSDYASPFADKKARNVGDILTIVINESTTQRMTKSSTNEKEANVNIGAGTGFLRILKAAGASGSDSFEANGSATDTSRFSGQITVTVVEVLPNDNMIVEGSQSIWQNRNEQKITFRGIVRRDDVTMNNTVPSSKVANAELKFSGKGPLNAKQRQGLLTQLFNIIF